ncbi:hypothetical protein IOC45_07930 [Vibrio vulnificus]|nr:hypothetical protein [Vibrio vulnificus]MCD1423022.1 hypothetical protein [Vibrio vulnificus]
MSIQNYFADFLEESPVDVAQLTTFSEHIPDEDITANSGHISITVV